MLTISAADEHLIVSLPDEPPCTAVAQSEEAFFAEGQNAMLRFRRDENGGVNVLLYRQGAHTFPCRQLEAGEQAAVGAGHE